MTKDKYVCVEKERVERAVPGYGPFIDIFYVVKQVLNKIGLVCLLNFNCTQYFVQSMPQPAFKSICLFVITLLQHSNALHE